MTGGGEDHGVHAFGFRRKVGAHFGFEGLAINLLVGLLDCNHVRVTTANQDVVQEGFLGASTFQSFVDAPDVVPEGPAKDGCESKVEVRARLTIDISFEAAVMTLMVCVL